MFVFQINVQKPLEQAQNISTNVYTGKDAQRIAQGLSRVCEPLLSKVQGKPDAF